MLGESYLIVAVTSIYMEGNKMWQHKMDTTE